MKLAKALELKQEHIAVLAYPPDFDLAFLVNLSGQKVTVKSADSVSLYGYQFKALKPPLSVGETALIEATAEQITLHYGVDKLAPPHIRKKLRRYREAPTHRKILMLLLSLFN